MLCESVRELIPDYFSGAVDRALTEQIENHLAACSGCKDEVAAQRRIWSSLDAMERVEPPMFFHENLMSRLEADPASPLFRGRKERARLDWRALFRPQSLAFAALVLILVLAGLEATQTQRAALNPIGWVVRLFRPAPAVSPDSAPVRATFASEANGGSITLHLPALNRRDAAGQPVQYHFAVSAPDADGRHVSTASDNALFLANETTVTVAWPSSAVGSDLVHVTVTQGNNTTPIAAYAVHLTQN